MEADKKGRTPRIYKTYRKKKATELLGDCNKLPEDGWTDQESSTLLHCANLLERMPLDSTIANLHQFYSIICDSSFAKARSINILPKTEESVKFKLERLSKLQYS